MYEKIRNFEQLKKVDKAIMDDIYTHRQNSKSTEVLNILLSMEKKALLKHSK